MRYWNTVPHGTWVVVDTQDAIDAMSDVDSTYAYDDQHNRINVFGPPGKALIIDLNRIKTLLPESDFKAFMDSIKI